jgi:hypothetical protein
VYGGTLTNCTLSGNSAIGGSVSYQYLCGQQEGHIVWCTGYSHVPGHGGGAYGCTLNNCTLTGNSADHGGGASSCTLSNCTLSSNRAYGDGGGASYCTFNNCTLIANSATNGGGGAYWSTLNNCALSGNSAGTGGGAYAGTLNNCTLTGNSGAGASHSTLNNCTLSGNTDGGGAVSCTLNNCTLTGNSGGGVLGCTLTNCIAYFNSGANYDSSCTLNYSCTTPLPASGVGNMSSDPQLASASLLSALSPCIARGSYAAVSGTDIDGEAWAKPPSIGCDEYHAGALTGPLRVGITASITNVVVGFAAQLTALIDGRAAASVWDFGDGVTVSNQPYTSHAWAAPGDYSVVLRAYNESHPGGVSATVTIHVVAQPIHYVAADSANPVTPYASWATAAANIQDAVDAATVPGALVLVTNGTYAIGGRTVNYTTNRVVVDKLLTVRSVNGPRFTTIDGGGSVRCVYLTISATLSGLTLTNGYANSGGGVFCESTNAVATICVLNGNFASEGGGVRGCTLNNCMLSGNSAWNYASGAEYSTLNNCTLAGNSGLGAYCSTLNNCALSGNSGDGAHSCTLNNSTLTDNAGGGASDFCKLNNCTLTGNAGGGASYYCTLINCIAYFNSGGNYDDFSTLNYCCTTPQPTNGVGNITNVPLFVDQASGNLRLQSNSPCINAGLNALAPASPDLDGNSRIAGGAVDIGAYEFQSPTSTISYAWLQQFNLPINPATDTADPDGDGVNNYHEWLAGTAPTNPFSSPAQLTITPGGTNLVLTWPTNALGFTLQSTTNLDSPAVWRTNSPAPVVIDGQNTVSNPITGAQQFFRLSR